MTKKQIKFLLEDNQVAQLKALVDVSGLTQQAYLEKVALAGVTSSDSVKDQTIASQQQTIRSLSEQLEVLVKTLGTIQKADTVSITGTFGTKCQVGVCVRGAEAQEAILKAEDNDKDLVLFENFIWSKGKTANGSQVTLRAMVEVPDELLEYHRSLSEWQRVSLSNLYKAIDHYKRFTDLEGYDQLAPHRQRGYLSVCCRYSDDPDYIEEQLTSAQGWIAEATHTPGMVPGTKSTANASPAMVLEGTIEVQEVPSTTTIAVIEPDTNDSVQDEVIAAVPLEPSSTEAQASQLLTKEELVERLRPQLPSKGMVNTIRINLGTAKMKTLEDGFTAKYDPESLTWVPTDETREHWVKS